MMKEVIKPLKISYFLAWLMPAWNFFSCQAILATEVTHSLTTISDVQPIQESDFNTLVNSPNDLADEVTSVAELSDVQLGDWELQALESLVERYHCVDDSPEVRYYSNQSMTRHEFATELNTCLETISELNSSGFKSSIVETDLIVLERLQTNFATELEILQGQIEGLEARTTLVESQQFSTTVQLRGQAIFAVTAGSFSGDELISPTGTLIADDDPNATLINRVSLFFNASFNNTDQLQVRLTAGSDGADDHPAGLLEPNFASTLDFSVPGRTQFTIGRLFYTFSPMEDLSITIGPRIVATDYVDRNSYANASYLDFSTQALVNNFVLFTRPAGAGAVIDWQPEGSPFKLRGVYVAGNANSFSTNGESVIDGPRAPVLLFPTRGGEGGLLGDPYESIIELEYSIADFALRLQYANGTIFGSRFNAFGANFELALSPEIAIFGRYGYGIYLDSTVGDVHPNYWMGGIAVRDVLTPGAIAGIAVGQPFIEERVGNASQTNFEAFYNFPINDHVRVTPLIQIITNAGNQSSNGTIVTGTLRTVFAF
ncbi:iron uptake porin [Oscillatoria sp. FACHB-1407]|uniref:iron uptake porin n=1 Tax=Oscillatoria sp. FACHB-1407 TaxID=2692847 RepID=UPI001681E171|nr:iron uptake porin [Oscillatoria sp. FACHB-1407]MBD2463682.1 iron uptake porin [Oscillatoria sp. FACHB-1407]